MIGYENENDRKSRNSPRHKKIKMPPDSENEFSYENARFKPIRLSQKDLPHFDGRTDEDARMFMNKYEMISRFNYWTEKELIDHFHMCLDQTALSWLINNLDKCKKWADLKIEFLSFFGKSQDDLVLEKLLAKKYAMVDPNLFIFQVLDNLAVTESRASEIRKIDALYDALPGKLKVKFLESDRPKSVDEFSAKLKCIARAAKARMRYEDSSTSKDSGRDKHRKEKETQIFALVRDMQAQIAKLTAALDQTQHQNSPHQQFARPAQHSRQLPDHQISSISCSLSQISEHEASGCAKLSLTNQQSWNTDKIDQRDENDRTTYNDQNHAQNQEN